MPGAQAALGVWGPPEPDAPGGGRDPGILGGGGMSAAAVRGSAPARAGAWTHGTLSVLRKKRSTAATASSSPACAPETQPLSQTSAHDALTCYAAEAQQWPLPRPQRPPPATGICRHTLFQSNYEVTVAEKAARLLLVRSLPRA